ncbi:DNA polymerase IV [Syntrophotalea carbinolica DSM 2380]|uniref:DNA polymerase IV n=2 Tax=Syntrophotalea carbinolica TaxID=19 RepID=Q39ZU3_SYNC1|nr:DNA polymerase IV [Syntrophotalea carbinolica DSM 2380]
MSGTQPEKRIILHLDMDAFYASVEQLDSPELKGQPVVVGGHRSRGVVCACSYEARTFGIHSAMPMSRALRLCPQAIVQPVRMARYQEISRQVFDIFGRYTDLVEPLSVDEAFLDVTASRRLFGEGWDIAEKIRRDVRDELGLPISAGIAPNKFLAKLASEQAKPDGVFQVPERVDDFLLSLPLKRLWGVGPVLLKSLQKMGLRTVADLRHMDRADMERCFGQAGERLIQLAHGEDERPVEPQRSLKSIGHEDTFDQDIFERETMHVALLDLVERVAARLRKHGLIGTTLTLKVKYADFSTVTRSRSVADGICHARDMLHLAKQLLEKTEAGKKPVRLLGVSLANLMDADSGQGLLFDEDRRNQLKGLEQAMDHVRERYGEKGLCRATLVGHRRRSLTRE